MKRELLISGYEQKLKSLKTELDLRLKVETHEIKERKDESINDLMKNHEEAFKELKTYYNEITGENLELIRMYKEKLVAIRSQIEKNETIVEHLREKRVELKAPLNEAINQRTLLQKQLKNYEKDKMALKNAVGSLEELKKRERDHKEKQEELTKKFAKIESQRNDMYQKFDTAVHQLKARAAHKNKVLDQVLAVRQAELEKKEVQMRELVQRSQLDQATVDDVTNKVKEAVEAKNSIVTNLRYSIAHATKAYNDAIRVYESKLVTFGIPAEELSLELLETCTYIKHAGRTRRSCLIFMFEKLGDK